MSAVQLGLVFAVLLFAALCLLGMLVAGATDAGLAAALAIGGGLGVAAGQRRRKR